MFFLHFSQTCPLCGHPLHPLWTCLYTWSLVTTVTTEVATKISRNPPPGIATNPSLLRHSSREVLFPNLEAETAPARRPWPGKNRENCAECRNCRARSAIAVSRHQRKPDPDRPRARFLVITTKNFQLLQKWWNRRKCAWRMWRNQVQVLQVQKSRTLAEGLPFKV